MINNKTRYVNLYAKHQMFYALSKHNMLCHCFFSIFLVMSTRQYWELNPFRKPYLYLNIWSPNETICSIKVLPIVSIALECCSQVYIYLTDFWNSKQFFNYISLLQAKRKVYLLERFIQGWMNIIRIKLSIFINEFSLKIAILTRFRWM